MASQLKLALTKKAKPCNNTQEPLLECVHPVKRCCDQMYTILSSARRLLLRVASSSSSQSQWREMVVVNHWSEHMPTVFAPRNDSAVNAQLLLPNRTHNKTPKLSRNTLPLQSKPSTRATPSKSSSRRTS